MRYLVFLAVAMLVLGGGHAYVAWRLTSEMSPRNKRRATIAIASLPVITLSAFALIVNRVESGATDVLAWIGFSCLGFSSLVFTLVVIRDLVWLVTWTVGRLRGGGAGEPASPERRRVVLGSLNAGKVGMSSLLFGYGALDALDRPRVREVPVPIDGLPAALAGFRIVQLTDIHVGATIKRDYVDGVVRTANALDADMVAITGDVVDGSVERLRHDIAPLGELTSRHGTYVCTGNHEYYVGVHEWVAHLRSLGMRVLCNAHELIEVGGARLLVAGVTDHGAKTIEPSHASSPEGAMAGAPDHDVALLLAHQPRSILRAAPLGFHLQLSGHTHGGQFFPWTLFARLAQPYTAGLHRHEGTLIYVSRGTGYWGPPIRLGAPSEITLLTLVPAS